MKRTLNKIWNITGMIIFLWTAFWFVKVKLLHQYDSILNVILFTIGYCLLINYALATSVYWVVKRLKKEWEIRE
jgi:hypothetical protein